MQNFVSLHSAKYIKNSTKKENSNRSLNKLTNETIDNQPVNVPKNNEQEQELKKTTKRVEKVDDADDVVFEKRKTSPNPSEGGERKPLANYSSKYRHEGTLEHRHTSGLHARYSSICRHKRTLDYECKSGLHARRPSLYSQRGQTLCYIRRARKLGLPPFGRVGVGFWRGRLGFLEDRE